MKLQGKNSIVTGAGRGIGKAIAEKFLKEGSRVLICDLVEARTRAAVEDLLQYGHVEGIAGDVTDPGFCGELVNQGWNTFGELHVLVNNAGTTQVMPFALIEEEDWDEIVGSNLKNLFLVTQEAARDMVARTSGSIVNIGSIAGHRLLDVPVHYATAKAAVSGFTISLAAEFRRYGIRVNSVIPGMLEAGIARNVPEKEYQEYIHYCAAGRPGRMDEVAELVDFLASDRASYINAQNSVSDGGLCRATVCAAAGGCAHRCVGGSWTGSPTLSPGSPSRGARPSRWRSTTSCSLSGARASSLRASCSSVVPSLPGGWQRRAPGLSAWPNWEASSALCLTVRPCWVTYCTRTNGSPSSATQGCQWNAALRPRTGPWPL